MFRNPRDTFFRWCSLFWLFDHRGEKFYYSTANSNGVSCLVAKHWFRDATPWLLKEICERERSICEEMWSMKLWICEVKLCSKLQCFCVIQSTRRPIATERLWKGADFYCDGGRWGYPRTRGKTATNSTNCFWRRCDLWCDMICDRLQMSVTISEQKS